MPDGAYFSVVGRINAGAGGQTRVMLLRHRLFAQHLGIDVPILTYNPAASYDPIRKSLNDDDLLLPQSRVLNMYEDLRQRDLNVARLTTALDEPSYVRDGECRDDLDGQGRPWRRRWITPANVAWFEYLRTDGTVFARTRADSWAGISQVCGADGRVIGSWPSRGGLWRWWTTQIAPPTGDVFLISDSRRAAQSLARLDDPRFFVLHQMHNPHTVGRRHWTSPIAPTYQSSMDRLARLDALSCLTHRQHEDVARRFGATDNLVVISNPVEIPDPPKLPPARTPGRLVIIARLHTQKRLDQAIGAYALLVRTHPYARLDIYGDGPEREGLEQQIEKAGLAGRVTLHGHDPHAADQFWGADVAWLTSAFEGYGLVILEAHVRNCPVVSFDVPYGPSEQIKDGIDGRLVPAGDIAALARITGELLDDRALLESMRKPSRAGAVAHDHRPFLAAWHQVVANAVERKPTRTTLERVILSSERLDLPAATHFHRGTRRRSHIRLSVALKVDGIGPLSTAIVQWQAYTNDSSQPLILSAVSRRDGNSMLVNGDIPINTLAALGRGHQVVTLRLMLVWGNSAWQHDLRPGGLPIKVDRRDRVLVTTSIAGGKARRLVGKGTRFLRRLPAKVRAGIRGT